MSLKDDLMYPFGNPVRERLQDFQTRTAIKNVLKLARDKVNMARGEPEEIVIMDDTDCVIAEQSIQLVIDLINLADGKKKETNTNQTQI